MIDKKELIKEFILKHPKESGNWIYQEAKKIGLGIRKTNFLAIVRDVRDLPEPSKAKKEKSIPIIYRKVKPKPSKVKVKVKIPFEQTKFGKITKDLQKAHKISEKHAIIHARKILKISKKDYYKMNQKDVQILLHRTP